MKKSAALIALFTLSIPLLAQENDTWPRAGATWKYCLYSNHPGAHWTQSQTFEYTADTLLDGKTYAMIRLTEVNDEALAPDGSSWWVPEENMRTYFRQSGDTIYRYANEQDYIFMVMGIDIDESIIAFRSLADEWQSFACTDQMQLTVEAVSETDYNGTTYREVRFKDQDPYFEGTSMGEYTFIEGIGVKNLFPYIYEEHLSVWGDSEGETLQDCIGGVSHSVQGGMLYAYHDENVSIDLMECDISLSSEVTEEPSALHIYPNPSSDRIFIELPSHATSPVFLSIYDMSGRLVLSETIPSSGSLDIRSLPPGIYVAQVMVNDQSLSEKFVRL